MMGRSWWLDMRRVTGQWRRGPAKNEKSKEQTPLDLAAVVFESCSIREAYYGVRERERLRQIRSSGLVEALCKVEN